MKIFTIIGARPQFIKAAPVCRELADRNHKNILVHTGQHYDHNLSDVFFNELNIPNPDYNLNAGSGSPAGQMAAMMEPLEKLLVEHNPDLALVFGDTNSTLAATITTVKCGIPVAHIEGGERNFTRDLRKVHPASIPEEANRVLVDHVSSIIFCASKRAVDNLAAEGITDQVHWVGDISLDTFLQISSRQSGDTEILKELNLEQGKFILATVHRAINTDIPDRLRSILLALDSSDVPVILPIHPRTRKVIENENMFKGIFKNNKLLIIDPVGYYDMLSLEKNARLIVTDSGGVIREAFFNGVPSIIVDETTEWIDLVQSGWSSLVGADMVGISRAVKSMTRPAARELLLGDGMTRKKIVSILEQWSGK